RHPLTRINSTPNRILPSRPLREPVRLSHHKTSPYESLRPTFRRGEVSASASALASRHGNQHEYVNTGEDDDSPAPGWLASPTSATKRTPGWPRVYAAASC
ncbi:unnamed protein product, partial [Musa banksii]